MPVGGALEGGFAGVVVAMLCNKFGETLLVVTLVDAAFVSISAVRVENVDLAKRLVRVDAHAVVVLCVHDLLREGAILLHCAPLAK